MNPDQISTPGEWIADIGSTGLAWAWVGCAALLLVWSADIYRRCKKRFRQRLAKLPASETGVIYTISFALVFPIYLLLILFVGELSLLMIALMHTRAAAFAAARSAIVWESAEPSGRMEWHADFAAKQAMVSIASGMENHQTMVSRKTAQSPGYVDQLIKAYSRHGGDDVQYREGYMRSKIGYAMTWTWCDIEEDGDNLTATVYYAAPIHFPVIGHILGSSLSPTPFRSRLIKRSVTLPNERPETPDGKLGIEYTSSLAVF